MPVPPSPADAGRPPIALVTRLDPAEEEGWRQTLSRHLPAERIVSFADLSDAERRIADIAVVADPDPRQVAALPGLAWIHSLWAGVERLIAELGCAAPPIVRLTDPELARTMAEAVLAWTYYLQRDMPAYRARQQAGQWAPLPYRPPATVTVGLLGMGVLGSAAALRLREAGFSLLGWSRSEKALPGIRTVFGESGLQVLLAASDILVCLLPLTERTRGLLDGDRLAALKPGAALINFARGPILVETDLLAALDAGRISHAVLDVFATEPLPGGSPLWRHPGVTVLPHVSGPTDRNTAAAIVAANIQAYRASGMVPAAIDRALGY